MLLRVTSALVAVALIVSGCGQQSSPGQIAASGSEHYPSEGLSDWKSYADHVVAYRVVSDHEVEASTAEERARGEYLIGREITVTVETRLWSAPDAPALPGTFTMEALGWGVKDGQRRAMVFEDAPRVEVGERFVAPLVREDGRWAPMTLGSQLRLDGDRVELARAGGARGPVPSQLAGKSVEQVRAAVEEQRPDPVAERYSYLRPRERARAVLDAKNRDEGEAP